MEQSNRYAIEMMGDEAYVSWKSITPEDVCAFMGFSILMGINRQPATDDYWKRDSVHYYKPIAQRISSDRFRDISRYLHFVDNLTKNPISNPSFPRKVSSLYTPNCEIAIDEAETIHAYETHQMGIKV